MEKNYQQRITPQRFVYHLTSKSNRLSIAKKGLIGHSTQSIGYQNAIFAHNHCKPSCLWYPYILDVYDSNPNQTIKFLNDENFIVTDFALMNYDVWKIDTKAIKNEWFVDNVALKDFLAGSWYPYYVVTFRDIPASALKLIDYLNPYGFFHKKGEVAHVFSQYK